MKKIFFWPAVFCGIMALLALSTEKAHAELGVIPIGGNFTLTGTNGKPVSLSDFNERIVMIFFGYTHCPDVCPNAMSTMESVRNQLGDKAARVQIIFITLDPERDSPETLKTYVDYFGDGNIGLSGTAQEIASVAEKFRMPYKKTTTDSATDYDVDHSDFIYLIDTQGRTRALHRSTSPAKKMVNDILSLLN